MLILIFNVFAENYPSFWQQNFQEETHKSNLNYTILQVPVWMLFIKFCSLPFHSSLFRLEVIYCKFCIFLNGEKMNVFPRLTNVIWKISRYIRRCTSRYLDLSSPCRRKFTWNKNYVQETFLFTSKCLDSAHPRLWWNFMELLVTLALDEKTSYDFFSAIRFRAVLYQNQQKYEDAVSSFQKAIHFRPSLACKYRFKIFYAVLVGATMKIFMFRHVLWCDKLNS